jgi:hypothetical protein
MRRTWTVMAVTTLALLAAPALAEEAKHPPKPGPEVQKLGFFVGEWKSEGTVKENGFMPSGKFESKDKCEWFEGHFAVVCHAKGKSPSGATHGIAIMGWSSEEKVYVYYGVENNPMAMTTVPRGTVEGDVWTWNDESKMGGQLVKNRYVMTVTGKKTYDFHWDLMGPDGQWKVIMEGKAKRD